MVESDSFLQRRLSSEAVIPHRPTCITIHSRNNRADVLYVSSGARSVIGYTPSQLMTKSVVDLIADEFGDDYALIYDRNSVSEDGEDEADVHLFYLNAKHADGHAVLVRVTSITCSSCVIAIGTAYPEITGQSQKELEVKMIDKAMKRVNITREKEAQPKCQTTGVGMPNQITTGRIRNEQVKVAFILERADMASLETAETGRRLAGPLVVFCTGSVSHLIEADTSDMTNYPFLKLVAPESVTYVASFLDRLLNSSSVMFDTFALVKHPHIDSDIFVSDEENPRIIVECLGAAADDGVVLLLRHMRTAPAPKRDTLERHIQRAPLDINMEDGYQTLADLISSDGETSEAAGEWLEPTSNYF